MNTFLPDWRSYSYISKQYLAMMQSAFKLNSMASEIYMQASFELFTSPQNFVKRNLSYWREVTTPPQPAWQTSYREVFLPEQHSQIIKLLDFSKPSVSSYGITPTLILPPQAGHHSYIADYSPEQSQTQTLLKSGLTSIFCIEWLEATSKTKHTRIEDYIEGLRFCIDKVGGRVNLVGDCQGGWLAAIYAALYPETVNSLTVAGAPIDFQAGSGQIKETVNYNARTYPDGGMAFYRGMVKMGGGVLNGRFLVQGFNVMRPGQTPERYLNLYSNINDPAALKRFREMKNWYDYPQNIAGDFYLWLVQHLFRDNELIKGKLIVGGKKVDLKRITCPLFLLAGTKDHVTPAVQVFEMASYVGTPSKQIEKHLVDAGHIGLFMGRSVLNNHWSVVGRAIAELSRPVLPEKLAS